MIARRMRAGVQVGPLENIATNEAERNGTADLLRIEALIEGASDGKIRPGAVRNLGAGWHTGRDAGVRPRIVSCWLKF